MTKLKALSICLLCFCINLQGQIGGVGVYKFLNLSPSARITGLGGQLISVRDFDVSNAFLNPAVLNSEMHQHISFNHNFYLESVGHGYVAYGHHFDQWNLSTHGSIKYITYGDFDQANEFGDITGTFDAKEYAITLGAAYPLYERLSVGLNFRTIISTLAEYNSMGLGADLGAFYEIKENKLAFALVAKHIGAQISTYEQSKEDLPFEMQFAVSKELKHLPFRITITYRYLDRWNILYDDPNNEEDIFFFGEDQSDDGNDVVDNLFRHFVFSGEFMLGKKRNFRIRLAYDHLKSKELAVAEFRSFAGFSGGLGIKINRFKLDYSLAIQHIAGNVHHLGISTNISSFTKENSEIIK